MRRSNLNLFVDAAGLTQVALAAPPPHQAGKVLTMLLIPEHGAAPLLQKRPTRDDLDRADGNGSACLRLVPRHGAFGVNKKVAEHHECARFVA